MGPRDLAQKAVNAQQSEAVADARGPAPLFSVGAFGGIESSAQVALAQALETELASVDGLEHRGVCRGPRIEGSVAASLASDRPRDVGGQFA